MDHRPHHQCRVGSIRLYHQWNSSGCAAILSRGNPVNMRPILNHLHLLLALLLSGTGAHAASLTLSPAADTSLFEQSPDANLGASALAAGTIRIGPRSRALFRFDASAVPAGATIT